MLHSTKNRWLTIGVILILSLLVFFNTYKFFQELKVTETEKMKTWAMAQQEFQSMDTEGGDLSITVLHVLTETNISTPMLLYSHEDDIYEARNITERNSNTKQKLDKLKAKFESENTPIKVLIDDQVMQTLYYGNSPLLNKLKYYPALLILFFVLFFIAVYFYFKTSRASEQNKLWAGMAKETAHQIGTPLSSLMAWAEILKTEAVNQDYILEMEKDINRLNKITDRFSKIGSLPNFELLNIVEETSKSIEYLQQRTSKLIKFHIDFPKEEIKVHLNEELFSWTMENLIKNSIDAMKGKGDIFISIEKNSKDVSIFVRDTGKGIPKRIQNDIFSPGYTTKKRGWGLGLSLAKRIIEEYHYGKIKVLHSSSKGTTMQVNLQIAE